MFFGAVSCDRLPAIQLGRSGLGSAPRMDIALFPLGGFGA